MGMSIRLIYADGSMSPECPIHGSEPDESCGSCMGWAHTLEAAEYGSDDNYLSPERIDAVQELIRQRRAASAAADDADTMAASLSETIIDPNHTSNLASSAGEGTDIDDVWLRKR